MRLNVEVFSFCRVQVRSCIKSDLTPSFNYIYLPPITILSRACVYTPTHLHTSPPHALPSITSGLSTHCTALLHLATRTLCRHNTSAYLDSVERARVNLYFRIARRPLLRARARIPRWPSLCCCGDISVDRAVFKAYFMTSTARKWWSREEANKADDEPNAELQKKHGDEHRVISRRIHILGVGTVGIFVAHALAGIPNRPPLTLLLHRRKLWIDWHQDTGRPETLEVITEGLSDVRKNIDVERVRPSWKLVREPPTDEDTIHNLILTVKGPRVLSALSLVSHRLNQRSTIVFLQTGMGILEEVNEKLFKDVEARPNYILGLITHGLYPEEPFSVNHAGMGTTALGLVPKSPPERAPDGAGQHKDVWPPTSRYLLRTLTRTPVLAAAGFSPTDLMLLQLDKLAANAVIHPLTVMFDCKNGDLLFNNSFSRVMRLLLSEISLVIRSLPELQGVPNVQMRFSPERLESMIVSIVTTTAGHLSGMLREVRAGNETEIDYINGYFIKRGEEIGIKCVMNYMLLQLVKGKRIIINKEVYSQLPVEGFLGPP